MAAAKKNGKKKRFKFYNAAKNLKAKYKIEVTWADAKYFTVTKEIPLPTKNPYTMHYQPAWTYTKTTYHKNNVPQWMYDAMWMLDVAADNQGNAKIEGYGSREQEAARVVTPKVIYVLYPTNP